VAWRVTAPPDHGRRNPFGIGTGHLCLRAAKAGARDDMCLLICFFDGSWGVDDASDCHGHGAVRGGTVAKLANFVITPA